ncbi:MAG: MerR family transcriptional regulator [Chloroflexota bacterium]
MDSGYLQIGEAADLLDLTPKALRHYEKVGLIEPTRSEGDYRLYSPELILRLQRIKQLQALGLSLRHNPSAWSDVLEALLDEIEAEMTLLDTRRERIETLLAEGMPDALGRPLEPVAVPEAVYDYLNRHLPEISAEMWQREREVYALLVGAVGGLPVGTLPVSPYRENMTVDNFEWIPTVLVAE